MKRSADFLIDGEYKRIDIWNVIHWKTFEPEYWERNKDYIYSIRKNVSLKEKMVFVSGKNGVPSKSYFRFKSHNSNRIYEGYEESYRHEFECISRLDVINIKVKGEPVKIYVNKAVQEEVVYTNQTRFRVVDVMVYFTKSEPTIYYEKWAGKLAIEIYYSNKVDGLKIKEFRDLGIPIIEFNTKNWEYIKENFKTQEEEEKQYKKIVSKLNNTLYVSVLVDPISKEYLNSAKINELDVQNRELKEQLRLATINEKKKLRELSLLKMKLIALKI